MPRKSKGIHTSPLTSGEQNLPKHYEEAHKDDEDTMTKLMPVWDKGFKNRENYKGLWTEEALTAEINNYFNYCFTNEVKPAKVGLALWLGISKSQLFEWVANKAKYSFKSELASNAFDLIELSYINRGEKNPTMNIFLLKAMHGYTESSNININTDGKTNPDEIADAVSKLALDK